MIVGLESQLSITRDQRSGLTRSVQQSGLLTNDVDCRSIINDHFSDRDQQEKIKDKGSGYVTGNDSHHLNVIVTNHLLPVLVSDRGSQSPFPIDNHQ
ncbi:hypothetical protein E5676_scaffold142G001330 [Cucumis melo var. makuwa]|uniref:Uncharacterized protein n=1 Tax=Cucumis melo var. makuwa TaxID=1194695 RepID=A0A5D3DHS7_CUCMM|nr:hypothetical protein E5676_scaffold142G001330 [Cucumis melo var. makuwa]